VTATGRTTPNAAAETVISREHHVASASVSVVFAAVVFTALILSDGAKTIHVIPRSIKQFRVLDILLTTHISRWIFV